MRKIYKRFSPSFRSPGNVPVFFPNVRVSREREMVTLCVSVHLTQLTDSRISPRTHTCPRSSVSFLRFSHRLMLVIAKGHSIEIEEKRCTISISYPWTTIPRDREEREKEKERGKYSQEVLAECIALWNDCVRTPIASFPSPRARAGMHICTSTCAVP